jgi:hypothetical protein
VPALPTGLDAVEQVKADCLRTLSPELLATLRLVTPQSGPTRLAQVIPFPTRRAGGAA